MRVQLIFMNICAKSSLTNQVTTIFSQPQRLLIAQSSLAEVSIFVIRSLYFGWPTYAHIPCIKPY